MFLGLRCAIERRATTLSQQRAMGQLIDGKAIAKGVRKGVKKSVSAFKEQHGRVPGLAVVLVGSRPDSQAYVRSKIRETEKAGMISKATYLDETVSQEELLSVVQNYNNDKEVDGILVQLPLPKALNEHEVIETIDPTKDVDGLTLINV